MQFFPRKPSVLCACSVPPWPNGSSSSLHLSTGLGDGSTKRSTTTHGSNTCMKPVQDCLLTYQPKKPSKKKTLSLTCCSFTKCLPERSPLPSLALHQRRLPNASKIRVVLVSPMLGFHLEHPCPEKKDVLETDARTSRQKTEEWSSIALIVEERSHKLYTCSKSKRCDDGLEAPFARISVDNRSPVQNLWPIC